MENFIISRYIRLFESLAIEVKLELISKLTENVKKHFNKKDDDKSILLNELFGAWRNENEEDLITEIYSSRTSSNKTINFDS